MTLNKKNSDLKVHIGFGFHVNCYHSYRGDTPDEFGFGGDIRIMRNTIKVLDKWNEKGIGVKGTWDFENAYSLEKILPEYAPDIIENVRRRQVNNGDENILMGYNNGAMSAMNEAEFKASVNMAVTNEYHSGLKDVFGDCEMIIRPQEVMFTPIQAKLYKEVGVKAVCLYYSCTPFDAFRTLIPQLDDEVAFNPVTYKYNEDEITIIPTYCQSDIMDAGTLRWLVTDLHQKQLSNDINHDVFIFINMDADSFLWEELPVPAFLKKYPNVGGLNGLIEEIADLDYIVFDTPGNYLKHHNPLKTITFTHDCADGNFSGYASWAEKPFNRQIWTRIERARAVSDVLGSVDQDSFDSRIRLLSTTHFGLASPVLNITREKTALSLSQDMLDKAYMNINASEKVIMKSQNKQRLFKAQLALKAGYCFDVASLNVAAENLRHYTALPLSYYDDKSLKSIYLVCLFDEEINECILDIDVRKIENKDINENSKLGELITNTLSVKANEKTSFPSLFYHNELIANIDGYITYDKRKYSFSKPSIEKIKMNKDGEGISFKGEIHLPNEINAGYYQYDFFTLKGIDTVFVNTDIKYPYTKETDEISSQASNLGRYTDHKWIEVVPFEISLDLTKDAKVIKRNFFDDISEFKLSSFWESFTQNSNIDSFNNQLTGGILAACDDFKGVALSHDRCVLGSMAHSPMRLRSLKDRVILSMNPFGTYYGKQHYYPSRGNGCLVDVYNASMPQAQTLAPAYNGMHEQSIQAISYINGNLTEELEKDLKAIADGVIVYGNENIDMFKADNSYRYVEDTKHLNKGLSRFSGSNKLEALKAMLRLIQNVNEAKKKVK